jgi:group I intron endonuclease
MGYVYKITNIITKKCYIGETIKDNPILRWNEHKRKIEKGIGCPALQDAVKKYGIENFRFEILIICFDEDRYRYEMEYIKKYNTIVPNGYNLTKGGEGGGFHGKKHSKETIEKIVATSKQKYIDNPELRKEMSERQKKIMNTAEIREKIKNGIKNSEKMKNARENKMLGNYKCRKHTEESKIKIRESAINQYIINGKRNTENHRIIMAQSKGIKVNQYDMDNNFLNSYISVSDAYRKTGVSTSSICNALNNKTSRACGFIWKKAD